jgi:hypothetical protein
MPLALRRDYHQTIEYAGVMELGGWRAVAVPGALVFVQRTPARVFAKMQRPARIDAPALHRFCAALGIDELHVEPALAVDLVGDSVTRLAYTRDDEAAYIAAFAEAGFAPIDARWAHTKTLVLDVCASHDELVATFDRKVRQESKYAYELRYDVRSFDDLTRDLLDEMSPLHAAWMARDHGTYDERFLAALRRCFGRHGAVIFARAEHELVGVLHVLFVDRVAICFDSFTAPSARESFANTGLFLEAARAGRDRGCDLLDLCACWDERIPAAHSDWKGFTAFKQKFSSTEIYYPPTFALQNQLRR